MPTRLDVVINKDSIELTSDNKPIDKFEKDGNSYIGKLPVEVSAEAVINFICTRAKEHSLTSVFRSDLGSNDDHGHPTKNFVNNKTPELREHLENELSNSAVLSM